VRLLVTRPSPDGERTASTLRAHGHVVLMAPVLRMETLDCMLADQPYAAVVMTSANAARAIAGHPRRAKLASLPAFTVGRYTAQAAQAVGFREVHCADGDRHDLADLLRGQLDASSGPLLYLTGEDGAGDIELAPAPIITAVVYRMVKEERFPAAVETALAQQQIDGVLHFSRRSAQAYLECAIRAGLTGRALEPLHFCLSCQVAEPLATTDCAGIKIAPRPDEATLVELVNRERFTRDGRLK
jgi:uroporphyrinogen-III synthase